MNKIAVVTGAGGDIGSHISLQLADMGYAIAAIGQTTISTDRIVAKLQDKGFRAWSFVCDVANHESVAKISDQIKAKGEVCILVNNAGASLTASVQSSTPELWQKDIELNLNACFYCFHHFQDHLIAQSGAVVNIASVNGLMAAGHPAYSAAKAGMIHFSKLAAVEYGRAGVRINVVAPGTVKTQAWQDRINKNPQVFEEVSQWYATGNVCIPEEVANVVSFLCSDKASAITGVCVPVDHGLTAGFGKFCASVTQNDDYSV